MTASLPTPSPPVSRWCRWCRPFNGRACRTSRLSRRSTFVTQLIATAEHVPQTRSLRRATPADAQAAYGARRHQVPRAPASGPDGIKSRSSRSQRREVSATARPATGANLRPAAIPGTPPPAMVPPARPRHARFSARRDPARGSATGGWSARARRRLELGFGRSGRLSGVPPEAAAAAVTVPRRARSAMPDRKSTSASSVSRKKVEVPNCGSSSEFRGRATEHQQRQQMVGEILRAGTRALDDLAAATAGCRASAGHRSASPASRCPTAAAT